MIDAEIRGHGCPPGIAATATASVSGGATSSADHGPPGEMRWTGDSPKGYRRLYAPDMQVYSYPLTVNRSGMRKLSGAMADSLLYLEKEHGRPPIVAFTGTSGASISNAVLDQLESMGVSVENRLSEGSMGLIHIKSQSASSLHRADTEMSPLVDRMMKERDPMVVFIDDLMATGKTYEYAEESIAKLRARAADGEWPRDPRRGSSVDVVMVPGSRAVCMCDKIPPSLCMVTGEDEMDGAFC
jgi:hypothetical protein